MRIVHIVALLGLLAISREGVAQSVFNGTWRPNPQTFSPTREADAIELRDGIYECSTCTPAYKVKADGTDQVVKGGPYFDTLRVTIIDDHTIQKVAKKGGNVVAETKTTVSADGRTETDVQTLYFMAPRPIEMTTHSTRVSAPAKGAHGISGEWRMTDGDVSNHAEDSIFSVSGNTFVMSDRMGRSFSARLDGTDSPYKGSDEFNSVSLKKIDDRTIEETDKKNGVVMNVSRWTVGSDGKTMHVRFDDKHGHVQEQDGHKVD